jgi:hypothetical protein
MFYIVCFILAWIIWLKFADKARWREILPVCIFAKCLALATDVLMFYYPLWEYIGPPPLIHLADDLGIYPVVTYLFIQGLPKRHTIKIMFFYWLMWTTVAIAIELIYVHSGHMRYDQWWTAWHSYAADWLLYLLFFQFHKILKLEKLSSNM